MWFVHDGRGVWYGFCGNYLEEGKLLRFKGVLHSKLSLSHETKSFIKIKSKDFKDIKMVNFLKTGNGHLPHTINTPSFESLVIDPNIRLTCQYDL